MKLRQIKKVIYSHENYFNRKLKNIQRYKPHTLETKLATVNTYRNNNSISFICRLYKSF